MRYFGQTILIVGSALLLAFTLADSSYAQSVKIYRTPKDRYSESQVELIIEDGIRVLIDIADPKSITRPVTAQDVLLTTHKHGDHYNRKFADAFPGRQLCMEEGSISLPNLEVTSIAASHSSILPGNPGGGGNYAFIIDIAQMRIVHFGDFGQNSITPEQLIALKNIDIAFMMFYNEANIAIMDQLKPRIIIPTHLGDSRAIELLAKQWNARIVEENWVECKAQDLPSEMTALFVGDWAKRVGEIIDLKKWQDK